MLFVLLVVLFNFSEAIATPYIVGVPALDIHETCGENLPRETQGVYGHSLELVEDLGNGWGLLETEDGCRGYGKLKGLVPDDVRWRTSERLVQVASVAGLVYPAADTEIPAFLRLPFGARVEVMEEFDANRERWLRVCLADGTFGWMQRGDLEKPKIRTLEEVIALAQKFLEIPYVWGGTSSDGFDCSGFVQTLFRQMGVFLPRNSREQATSDKLVTLNAPELPGDIVFFGETKITHVGLYLGEGKFIHAGVRNHKPRVNIENLADTEYKFALARRVKS